MLDNHKKISYANSVGEVRLNEDEVVSRTIVPQDKSLIPRIIGWSGPARVGTTALLFLLANLKSVDRLYFQPQKTILRGLEGNFVLNADDKTICMKEVYGQVSKDELYDPIDMLLKSGVPAEKITWIFILREPVQTFASWRYYFPESSIDVFVASQNHTISQYHKYRKSGVKVVPFVYDNLIGREEIVVKKLLKSINLDCDDFSMEFNEDAKRKIVLGQARKERYYNSSVKPTVDKARFLYARNTYPMPIEVANQVKARCDKEFQEYRRLACRALEINAC